MNSAAEAVKAALTMEQAAERYGFHPNRAGYINCPFHNEKTGSMKLYPGSGGFYCFGCNAHGSVIDFVMRLFDLSFQQAVIRISSDFGLGLTGCRPDRQEASRILKERRRQEAEKEAFEREYRQKAAEHLYWLDILRSYPPVKDGEASYIHPLWAEAVNRLPYLEYWLDENLGR